MRDATTRSKIKKMMDGLLYHCREMSEFMSDNTGDPYFDTDEGKRMHKYILGIMMNHVMALAAFMSPKEDVDGDGDPILSIEDILKDSLK